jgi:hypothetical protein
MTMPSREPVRLPVLPPFVFLAPPSRWRSGGSIYLGFVLMYAGIALIVNSAWTLLLLPGAVAAMQGLVIRREEDYLEARFGEAYPRYRARVRRWV